MKKFFAAIVIILMTVVVLYVFQGKEYKLYSDLKEAGYQSVVPTEMGAAIIIKEDGTKYQTNDYRVKVPVEIEGETKIVSLTFLEAYGDNSVSKGMKAYEKKTKVEGYFYYTEDGKTVYLSKTAATKEEYIEDKIKPAFFVAIIVDFLLIMPLLISGIMNLFSLPEVQGGYLEPGKLVVCSYRTYTYGMLLTICFGMCSVFVYVVKELIKEGNVMPAVLMSLSFLIFFALGIVLFLMMKNRIVIFYSKGFVYKTALGHTYYYQNEDVTGYAVINAYRNHSIRIRTKERNVWLNYYCTNYYRAEEVVRQKYPSH